MLRLAFDSARPTVGPMLRDFIATNRAEILARARLRVIGREDPSMAGAEVSQGLPLFLDQLHKSLHRASLREGSDHSELKASAAVHGDHLFHQGLTVAQVVNGYGDLCQVITGLAVEQNASIGPDEYQNLNLCLDDATAGAVTAFAHQRESAIAATLSADERERLGFLAHEMRNLLNAAILSFRSIQKGFVTPGGSTGAVHARSLLLINALIDRSLADVRLASGVANVQRIVVREVIEEVEIVARMVAEGRGLHLAVTTVDASIIVEADRQILAAALANLLQNALKFTRPSSTVKLRGSSTTSRVLIEIEDECGGLPPGKAGDLLIPFVQRGADRSGLGLGLSICMKAAKAMGGALVIRDLPGKGCIFALDLPKQPPPPTSIFAGPRKAEDGGAGSVPGGGAARDARSAVDH
jgi:signal transduction histidine kinase